MGCGGYPGQRQDALSGSSPPEWLHFRGSIRAYLLRALLMVLPSEPGLIAKGLASFEASLFVFQEVIDIQIRQVDPSYLAFLRYFDDHVPMKEDRPWLWPVMINGMEYGIPCTTQEIASGYAGYLRCAAVPEHGLYLRYMAPVPSKALLPAKPISPELQAELQYYEESRTYIEAEAQILYRLSGLGQMDYFWQRHSCDFQELDSVYSNWQPGFDAGHFLYPNEEGSDMPISKNGKAYYTKEQYEQAKYTGNALEYAQRQGYDLVRQGAYYTMREHDSMVFTPAGRWFWNSRGVNGGALEFMIYYEGRTITDAVLTLTSDPEYTKARPQERDTERQQPARQPAPAIRPDAPRYTFRLPEKAQNMKQMFYYLCGERGLEKAVVQEMIRQNRLYQSAYTRPDGKTMYNATFVYQDAQGKPVGAYQRGMKDAPGYPPYKRDVPGSDKRYGWLLQGTDADRVAVFEAAIDAASDASLTAMRAPADGWKVGIDRLSLEGLNWQPLQNYLEAHPNVRRVELMLDGDEAGRRAAADFTRRLTEQGYTVQDKVPPFGKDWNDCLLEVRAQLEPADTPQRGQEMELEVN